MHGAVPLQRRKPFGIAKDEKKTEAQESRRLKEVVSISPEMTAIPVAESGKCSQAQFCWSLWKTWPRNKPRRYSWNRRWNGHRIEHDLRSPDSSLTVQIPQLLQQEKGGIKPFHVPKSMFQGLKNPKDQITIYLGLFLTSGASWDTLKELIYWIPDWIGLRELIHPRWQIYSLPMNCISSIICKALFHLGRKVQHKSHSFQ